MKFAVAGLARIKGGDDRFYNNILIGPGAVPGSEATSTAKDPEWRGGSGLWIYNFRELPLGTGGNVFYRGAQPYTKESNPVLQLEIDPALRLVQEGDHFILRFNFGPELQQADTHLITTALLGKAQIAGLPYENPDGSPLCLNADYFGKKRDRTNPTPGPFERPGSGQLALTVW